MAAVGVAMVASKRLFMPSRERVDLLMALGHQAARAVDHARLYDKLEEKEKMVEVFACPNFHDLRSLPRARWFWKTACR